MALSKSLTTVTPFSKLLAMILFILFPLFSFYFGIQYGMSLGKSPKPTVTSTPTASCAAYNTCSEEAKLCADGSYVFRQQPNCVYAECPNVKLKNSTASPELLKNAKTMQDQIEIQVSQKTGIDRDTLTISPVGNDPSYTGGTYTSNNDDNGWWIAAKVNGKWLVTAIGKSTPLCKDVDPYYYPKSVVPTCKTDKGDITTR